MIACLLAIIADIPLFGDNQTKIIAAKEGREPENKSRVTAMTSTKPSLSNLPQLSRFS
jgi:hypothetical protein